MLTHHGPVTMIVNSIELRVAGFKLKSVLPPALEAPARGGCGHEQRDYNSGHDVSE